MPLDPSFYDDDDHPILDSTAAATKDKEEPEAEPEAEGEKAAEEEETPAEEEETPAEGEEEVAEEEEAAPEAEAASEEEKTEEKPAETEAESVHVVKVDGEPVEATLQELKDSFSLAQTSYKRMQEAADIKKTAEHVLQHQATDPLGLTAKVLKSRGYSDQQIEDYLTQKCEEFLKPRVEELTMTPEERALAVKRRELERLKQEIEESQKRKQAEEEAVRERALFERTLHEIDQALDQVGLPKDDDTCVAVGRVLLESWEAELELTPAQAVAIVKRDLAKRSEREQARLREAQRQRAKEALSNPRGSATNSNPSPGRASNRTQRRAAPKIGSFRQIMGED